MTVPALDLDGAAAPDPSETSRLGEAIERLLPGLEQFNRFEGIDQAARERGGWLAALERELPQQGCGLDETLSELAEVAIPHDLRNGVPGFNGLVTTAPTTAGTAATLAATVAGSQRWWVHRSISSMRSLCIGWRPCSACRRIGRARSRRADRRPTSWLSALHDSAHSKRLGTDPSRDGVPGSAARIYASTEVHHVVNRAAAVLGLGVHSRRVRRRVIPL